MINEKEITNTTIHNAEVGTKMQTSIIITLSTQPFMKTEAIINSAKNEVLFESHFTTTSPIYDSVVVRIARIKYVLQ